MFGDSEVMSVADSASLIRDWAGFAAIYNGAEYEKCDHDNRMKTAYEKEKAAIG